MRHPLNNILTLAYSTCPNDTFVFNALTHGLIDCKKITFKTFLSDVEKLNQAAKTKTYDVSKLSFAAIGHLMDEYRLLRSGAAIGRGCGPLIIAKPGMDLTHLISGKIAVPGLWTTAYMLLGLYLTKKPSVIPMPFDLIMSSVIKGDVDYGVIIHEGRFTYKTHGLIKLLDLGEWWEDKTALPIPLGGIAIRNDISLELVQIVETAIKNSVKYAFNNKDAAYNYIKKYAQEMEPSVIQQHIDLYVNDFSLDLGTEGTDAVNTLFAMGRDCGILPKSNAPLFATPSV